MKIPQSCPIIDKVISALKDTERNLRYIEKSDSAEECKEIASNIEYDLSGLADCLEEVRGINADLRDHLSDVIKAVKGIEV